MHPWSQRCVPSGRKVRGQMRAKRGPAPREGLLLGLEEEGNPDSRHATARTDPQDSVLSDISRHRRTCAA